MEFGVLGTVVIRRGRIVLPLPAAMPRTVLAALLLDANRVVSTARLTDVLWGDRPPASAAASLQNHIARLRTILGPADRDRIKTTAPGYLIRVLPGELDLDSFSALAGRGFLARGAGDWAAAAGDLGAALALWRGSPLADVPSALIQEVEVPRLEQSRLAALEARIDADLHLGRHEGVIGELGALIAAHPLREGFHQALMLACYQLGRQADALAAYRHARQLLHHELGVEPGAELRELHQRILRADPGSSGPATATSATATSATATSATATPATATPAMVPCQLPADIPDFTGRDTELDLLRDLFGAGARDHPGVVPLAVITGTGGSGKTALALHAAHQLKVSYPDGQLYLNLRGTLGPLPPGEVLPRLIRALGVDGTKVPADEDEQAGLLRTLLSERAVLIVLDDARDTAQVRPLLPGTASCGVLVTSRNRMTGLAGAHLGLDGLEEHAADALFGTIVGTDRMRAEPAATADVIRLTAGLPLAIRIAGARLAARPGWAIASLAERLASQPRLDELRIDDLAVRSSFQLSYGDLPGAPGPADGGPARTFRLLGILSGGDVSLPAAAALLATTLARARELLEHLVDAHLLESPTADRYRMHDLVHVFAAERARAEESRTSRAAAVRRLVSWYLRTADTAVAVLEPRIQRVPLDGTDHSVLPLELTSYDGAIAWCETERPNLIAATHLAASYELHALAWQLPIALRRFFRLGKYWADWTGSYEVALASARAIGDRAAQAWILDSIGEPYADQGRYDDAVRARAEAVAITRDIGDRRGQAATLINLGVIFGMMHRYDEAMAHFDSALATFRGSGDAYNEARALGNISQALRLAGRYDEALAQLRQALAIHARLGEMSFSRACAVTALGEIYYDTRRYDQAARCFRRAMTMCRALHDRSGEAVALEDLGQVCIKLDRAAAAYRFWSSALDIFTEIGDPRAAGLRERLAGLEHRGPAR